MATKTQRRKPATPSKKNAVKTSRFKPIIPKPHRISVPGDLSREDVLWAIDHAKPLMQSADLKNENVRLEQIKKELVMDIQRLNAVKNGAESPDQQVGKTAGLWAFLTDYETILQESANNIHSIGNRLEALTGKNGILKGEEFVKAVEELKSLKNLEGRNIGDLLRSLIGIHKQELEALANLSSGFAQVV